MATEPCTIEEIQAQVKQRNVKPCLLCKIRFGPEAKYGKCVKLKLLWEFVEKKRREGEEYETVADWVHEKWVEWFYLKEIRENPTSSPEYLDYQTVLLHLTYHVPDPFQWQSRHT